VLLRCRLNVACFGDAFQWCLQKTPSADYPIVQVHDKELKVVMIQNEVAKLTVDVLNTEAHNVQLGDTLKLLDEELADKAKVIGKYEHEIQRRNEDIEKKTRSVDTLNRKLEKLLCDMEGEDTGAHAYTLASACSFRVNHRFLCFVCAQEFLEMLHLKSQRCRSSVSCQLRCMM
jgi:hypothetical protein